MQFGDDFNRPDSTTSLGRIWSVSSATYGGAVWGVTSAAAYLATADSSGRNVAFVNTFSTNHSVSARLSGSGSAWNGVGLCVRWVNADNYILATWINSTSVWRIEKYVAGSLSTVTSSSSSTVSGTLTLSISGTSVTMTTPDGQVVNATVSDANLQMGTKVGLQNRTTATTLARWDNVSVSSDAGLLINDFVVLIIEADLSQAVEDIGSGGASYLPLWDVAVWDTDTWEDDVPDWTDISQWLHGLSTKSEFSRELTAYNAGRLTLTLDNTDGRFSPDNTSSPYRVGDSTTIGMLRPIQVRAASPTQEFVDMILFTGRLDSWDESFAGPEGATVTVTAVDLFADLGAVDPYEQTPAGAGESYYDRIERVLENAGYTGQRWVDPGTNTFQATTLAANALTELKLVADSEGGAVWAWGGSFNADDRNALIYKARSSQVQATISNTDGTDVDFSYENDSLVVAYDGSQVDNVAQFARTGSTVQTATSEASRQLYGDRVATRTDLVCETDAQVVTLANRHIGLFSNPERRIESLSFFPQLQPTTARRANAWDAILRERLQLRAKVRVQHTTAAGFTIDKYLFIRGIGHDITPNGWRTNLSFASATIHHALLDSRFDVGTWDTSAWSW